MSICCFLHLVAHNLVFIIQPVIGTGRKGAGDKLSELILVQVHHAGVAFIIFVINVVGTALAVGGFGLLFYV